jgi:hypothetical protein
MHPTHHSITPQYAHRAGSSNDAAKMPPAVNGKDKAKGRVLLPRTIMPLKYDLTLEVDLER